MITKSDNRAVLVRNGIVLALMFCVTSCAKLPKNPYKSVSHSRPAVTKGSLAKTSDAVLTKGVQGASAFLAISDNAEALRWRLAMIDSATESIDLQVFIWSNDECGRLIFDRIMAAANRGVKVRLLVDDMPKGWSDRDIGVVAREKNISIRRFNPGRKRKGVIAQTLQMSFQFRELNRRMHNKQILIDGRWAIVGGRNLGNSYYGFSKKYNNRDFDLLVTGPVLSQMGTAFDLYWNSDLAYPGEAMHKDISEKKRDALLAKFRKDLQKDSKLWEPENISAEPKGWQARLAKLPGTMVFGHAMYLQDSPAVKGDRGERLVSQLERLVPKSNAHAWLVTPYFIPTKKMIASLIRDVAKGSKHYLIVPSMESNNHTMAHSHYKKYRRDLLEAGANLYEFKGDPGELIRSESDTEPVKSDFIALHTKLMVQEGERVVLGSLNLDPRSMEINTENVLVIESPKLADQLVEDLKMMSSPENAWTVYLNENDKIRWKSGDTTLKMQPARGSWQRCKCSFYRLLPIEGQL